MRLIQNKKGYSLAFSLVFFLFAAVFGIIILTASSKTSGRLATLDEGDEGFYLTTSLFGVLKNETDGLTVSYDENGTRSGNIASVGSKMLGSFIIDGLYEVRTTGDDCVEDVTFSVAASGRTFTFYATLTMRVFDREVIVKVNSIRETCDRSFRDVPLGRIDTLSFGTDSVESLNGILAVKYREGEL